MTAALNPADRYHTGVVVPDLDEVIGRLSVGAGYRWTKTVEAAIPVITAAGPVDIPFKMVYSIDAPHLELVQEVPGTTWTSAPRNAAHHLGYWADDVLATGAQLERAGCAFEARAGGDGPPIFAYYLDPLCVRIEVVARNAFGTGRQSCERCRSKFAESQLRGQQYGDMDCLDVASEALQLLAAQCQGWSAEVAVAAPVGVSFQASAVAVGLVHADSAVAGTALSERMQFVGMKLVDAAGRYADNEQSWAAGLAALNGNV